MVKQFISPAFDSNTQSAMTKQAAIRPQQSTIDGEQDPNTNNASAISVTISI